MTNTAIFVSVIAIASLTPAADQLPLRYSKDLTVPATQREELVAVAMDSDVYAATRPGLPDVRLINGEGKEVSFLMRRATKTEPRTERRIWTTEKPQVRPLADGGLEITLQFDEKHRDRLPQGIKIVNPLVNFERRVRVFDSEDGENWRPLIEDAVIFDYSQYMDVRNDNVEFPESDRDRFRIVIDDVTVEQESQLLELTRRLREGKAAGQDERLLIVRTPFRIDRIEFWQDVVHEQASGDEKKAYPLADFRSELNADTKQTMIYVNSRREPLTSLTLETSSRNFSRTARVQVERKRGQTTEWQEIGRATLSRLDFRDLKREQLSISIPESREERYRIVVDNQNSAPLEITGVSADGNVYEAVFLAAPKTEYRMAYGNAEIAPPDYDILAVSASLEDGYEPLVAQLEAAQDTGAAQESTSSAAQLINNLWLLGGVAAVLVAILAWGLYNASRRLDVPQDE